MAQSKKKNASTNSFKDLFQEELKEELRTAQSQEDEKLFEELVNQQRKESGSPQGAQVKPKVQDFKTRVVKPHKMSNANVKTKVIHHSPKVSSERSHNLTIDLKNADYIQFAQKRMKELENEVIELRKECENLALAGDHFKKLNEERSQKIRVLESQKAEVESLYKEEKKILNETLEAKSLKVKTLQDRVRSLEEELDAKFNRVRVRERELESRLEILKTEHQAVTSSKDDMIVKLKKQNLILQSSLEKVRAQNKKSVEHLQDKEDALRRTVKALKLSLTMLESKENQ